VTIARDKGLLGEISDPQFEQMLAGVSANRSGSG
jgi:hypothetical protein